jgi:hypothetical protein
MLKGLAEQGKKAAGSSDSKPMAVTV